MESGHISIYPCRKMNVDFSITVTDMVLDFQTLHSPFTHTHTYLDMNITSSFCMRIISFPSGVCLCVFCLCIVSPARKSGSSFSVYEFVHLLHSLFFHLFDFLLTVMTKMTLIIIEKRSILWSKLRSAVSNLCFFGSPIIISVHCLHIVLTL